ncbi:MAG TPA: hypothetical protein VFQ80_05000, partial [Thermomicrobiales bacterium]|nr:hypothetical protein [Thermomicrobiales bacterium]
MTPIRVVARRRLQPRRRAVVAAAIAALVAVVAIVAAQPGAAAHPLGNFSVNQYSRIEALTSGLRLSYVLDLAELPTVQDRPRLDANNDGTVDAAERDAYLTAKLAEIAPSLNLTAAGANVPLRLVERAISFPPGQAGLATTRIEATFAATLPASASDAGFVYRDDYATDRQGWREIVVTHGADIQIDRSDAPAVDRSHALRAYPVDPLRNQPDQRAASFAYRLAPGAPAASDGADSAALAGPAADPLAALVGRADPTGAGLLFALALAAGWGAVHALSPGHGKTLVGAYLVGVRGTPRHALALGVTVTITHTAGVIALGAVILLASRTIVPERFYPWLSLLSGALV